MIAEVTGMEKALDAEFNELFQNVKPIRDLKDWINRIQLAKLNLYNWQAPLAGLEGGIFLRNIKDSRKTILVSIDPMDRKWRVTLFHGKEPLSHQCYPTRDEAFRSAIGIDSRDSGPAYGSVYYRVEPLSEMI